MDINCAFDLLDRSENVWIIGKSIDWRQTHFSRFRFLNFDEFVAGRRGSGSRRFTWFRVGALFCRTSSSNTSTALLQRWRWTMSKENRSKELKGYRKLCELKVVVDIPGQIGVGWSSCRSSFIFTVVTLALREMWALSWNLSREFLFAHWFFKLVFYLHQFCNVTE